MAVMGNSACSAEERSQRHASKPAPVCPQMSSLTPSPSSPPHLCPALPHLLPRGCPGSSGQKLKLSSLRSLERSEFPSPRPISPRRSPDPAGRIRLITPEFGSGPSRSSRSSLHSTPPIHTHHPCAPPSSSPIAILLHPRATIVSTSVDSALGQTEPTGTEDRPLAELRYRSCRTIPGLSSTHSSVGDSHPSAVLFLPARSPSLRPPSPQPHQHRRVRRVADHSSASPQLVVGPDFTSFEAPRIARHPGLGPAALRSNRDHTPRSSARPAQRPLGHTVSVSRLTSLSLWTSGPD